MQFWGLRPIKLWWKYRGSMLWCGSATFPRFSLCTFEQEGKAWPLCTPQALGCTGRLPALQQRPQSWEPWCILTRSRLWKEAIYIFDSSSSTRLNPTRQDQNMIPSRCDKTNGSDKFRMANFWSSQTSRRVCESVNIVIWWGGGTTTSRTQATLCFWTISMLKNYAWRRN